MGGYPTGPEECAPPECEPRVTSLRDPGPIAVFVFWAAMVAYVAMYFLFKLWRTRRHHMPSTRFELVVHNSNESPPTAKHKKEVSCRTAQLYAASNLAQSVSVTIWHYAAPRQQLRTVCQPGSQLPYSNIMVCRDCVMKKPFMTLASL